MSPIQVRTVAGALLIAVGAACSGGSHRVTPTTTTNSPRSSTTSTVAVGPPARCPRILPDRVASPGVVNLSERLVPLSATRLTVCRYGPLVAATPLTVKTQFTLADRATVAEFETAANALPPLGPGPIPGCLEDNGEALVLIFSDTSHAVTVRASLSGCAFVTNGVRTVSSSTPSSSTQWRATAASIEVAGCPSAPPVFAQPVLPHDPRGQTLVPITAASVRVCRYAPLDDPHPNTLNGFGVLDDESSVRSLEAEANRMAHLSNSPAGSVPAEHPIAGLVRHLQRRDHFRRSLPDSGRLQRRLQRRAHRRSDRGVARRGRADRRSSLRRTRWLFRRRLVGSWRRARLAAKR